MTPLTYFLLGLATSLHCVAMCGALVLTYSVKDGAAATGGIVRRVTPHLVYQTAKIASYMAVAVLLGVIAATLGGVIPIAGIRNWIMVGAGVFMIGLGLSMTGYFPWLRYLTPRPPKALTRLVAANRRRAIAESAEGEVHLATPLIFGLLTGLMPCGPLIAAQAGAMTSGSPLSGATLMLAFGLGTAPLMLAFGLASGYLGGMLRNRMQIVAAVAVVVFGLISLDRGLTLVGSPVTFEAARIALVGSSTSGAARARVVNGVPQAEIRIVNTQYVPSVIELPADVRTRIVVDRREDAACSNQLAIPQLGVLVNLKPFAKTIVDVPPAKAGSYQLTCGMGMMSGRIDFGAGGATQSWARLLALGAVVGVCVAAAWVVVRRRARHPDGSRGGSKASAAGLLGFTPVEIALVSVVVLLAILAGFVLGGARL